MQNKELLKEMEISGEYVFHGSPNGEIDILTPKQAYTWLELNKPDSKILDGMPAVSATPYSEIAIFRALINNLNMKTGYMNRFGINNGNPEFEVSSAEVLDAVKDKKGYVYVFNKFEFEPYVREGDSYADIMEWRSYKDIKPIQKIEVGYNDLPFDKISESIKIN